MSSDASIDAYFERINFAGSIAPTLSTLEQLHVLHPAAIPFENLTPLMRQPVRLELRNLEQKLLFEKRGGYCVEHNLLFKAMLEDLGFPVQVHGARVYWGLPEDSEQPVTHLALTVDVGGVTYLADTGFGNLTLTAPLRLRAEREQETPHETFRLLGGEPEWRVQARIGEEWRTLYGFEEAELTLEEVTEINDQASVASLFRDNILAARTDKGRRFALWNLRLNTHLAGGETETRTLGSVAEVKEVLTGTFGINLPPAEKLDPALEAIVTREQAGGASGD
ncbi:MAG TPA: arylamine N-acetyltransferase [Devosiaceae bacterium]|jgi:N-hydroxyarylamine O-acetyltransferase|nr:arylamine N-acetyltransferase [Devosiaceae bacterium]